MIQLSKVRQTLRLPRNSIGRDFVVGDLHGHRGLLESELDRVCFDPSRDRVLSVGDLIDRGPDSLGTLALLEEPWFHAVLGNHELMLLNHLGYYGSRLHCSKSYAQGQGAWLVDALHRHRKLVSRLADRVAALPLMLSVTDDLPYLVMHGDSHPSQASPGSTPGDLISVHKADAATASRANLADAMTHELLDLGFHGRNVKVSGTPMGSQPTTYVGHSPVADIVVHNSCVYIDQGVSRRPGKGGPGVPPTLLDHRIFARWIRGVTEARRLESCAA